VALVVTLVVTSVAGIASNPLFALSNQTVQQTYFLQSAKPNGVELAKAVVN